MKTLLTTLILSLLIVNPALANKSSTTQLGIGATIVNNTKDRELIKTLHSIDDSYNVIAWKNQCCALKTRGRLSTAPHECRVLDGKKLLNSCPSD